MPDNASDQQPGQLGKLAGRAPQWRHESGCVTNGERVFHASGDDASWLAERLNATGTFAITHNAFDRKDALRIEDVDGVPVDSTRPPEHVGKIAVLAPMKLARVAMTSCAVVSRADAPSPVHIRYDRDGVLEIVIRDALITNGAPVRAQAVWDAVRTAANIAISEAPVPVDAGQLAAAIADRAVQTVLGAIAESLNK